MSSIVRCAVSVLVIVGSRATTLILRTIPAELTRPPINMADVVRSTARRQARTLGAA